MFKEVEYYFHDKKLRVIDMQMVDTSVGIYDGWVIFDKKGKILEMHWDDAVYHLRNNSTKKELLKSSFKTTAIL